MVGDDPLLLGRPISAGELLVSGRVNSGNLAWKNGTIEDVILNFVKERNCFHCYVIHAWYIYLHLP